MDFRRQWLLILFVLMAGGGHLLAASREDRAYSAAVQAFDDKLYSVATNSLMQFLENYRKSTNAPTAVLLLAQAEFWQKNYAGAAALLTDPATLARAKAAGLADRYFYWQGEAQFARGDAPRAAQTFVSLTEVYPQSPLALNAAVEAAAIFGQNADWHRVDALLDDANGIFQRQARLDPASPQVANGRLWQAQSKCAQQNFTEAIQALDMLNPATLTTEQNWRRAYWLGRANLGLGDLDAALASTTNLLEIARAGHGDVWTTNLAESVASHALMLEKQGRLGEAMAALQENFGNGVPAGQQQQAILKLADLAIEQGNLTNAEAGLETFLKQYPDSPAAEIALLTLGELHLKDSILEPSATNDYLGEAQANLDQLLNTRTNSPLAGKALLARGWCHWLAGKYADSLADFQAAARLLPMSQDLAVARFKMGDAEFAMGNFAAAQTNYQAVLADFSGLPEVARSLGSRAHYQILRARLALHDTAGMEDSMRELAGDFFTNAPAESSLLLAGEGFSDFNSPDKAREVFQRFEAERTNSPLMPQVEFAIARTFEREQNWPAAAAKYQAWLQTYPSNELRPEVEYARDWAVWQSGDEARAFELFSQYPTNSAFAPLVYWWLGDHYFRLGGTNFAKAEFNYEMIFQDFPTNELAYPAQLMAGRAAMARSGYNDAERYFVALIDTNCTEELRDQARLAYCEALRWQMAASDTNNANLQDATNILAQMYPKAATNIVGAFAWSETGDCDLQLGALDAATNAYAQAFSSRAASQELRCRAQVGWGIVLEKKAEGLPEDARKALLDMAMEHYASVFYTDDATRDAWWTKVAGLDMLALARKTGGLSGADLDNFVKRLKTIFPQMQASTELNRLQ